MKNRFLFIISITVLIAALVIIFINGKKYKSDFSDLVLDFHNITPIDLEYSLYDSSKSWHVQPVLAIEDPGITDISNDFFLGPLFFSKRSTTDIKNANLKSLGILDLYYGKGTNRKQQSFVRITTNDDITYFKHINDKSKLIFESYYPKIEKDILRYLGNQNWYSY
jgi:hypothetical protein